MVPISEGDVSTLGSVCPQVPANACVALPPPLYTNDSHFQGCLHHPGGAISTIASAALYDDAARPPHQTLNSRCHLPRPRCFARANARRTVPAMMQHEIQQGGGGQTNVSKGGGWVTTKGGELSPQHLGVSRIRQESLRPGPAQSPWVWVIMRAGFPFARATSESICHYQEWQMLSLPRVSEIGHSW